MSCKNNQLKISKNNQLKNYSSMVITSCCSLFRIKCVYKISQRLSTFNFTAAFFFLAETKPRSIFFYLKPSLSENLVIWTND